MVLRIILAALIFLTQSNLFADDDAGGVGSGNSGDPWRAIFSAGQQKLKSNIGSLNQCLKYGGILDSDLIWIKNNLTTYLKEVAQISIEPVSNDQTTCAWTKRQPFAKVRIRTEKCNLSLLKDPVNAAKLLAHEIVHHFDIDNEEFADRVADRINNESDYKSCIPRNGNERISVISYSRKLAKVGIDSWGKTIEEAIWGSQVGLFSDDRLVIGWIRRPYISDEPKWCVSYYADASHDKYFSSGHEATLDDAKRAANANCMAEVASDCKYLGTLCSDGKEENAMFRRQ